MTLKKRKSINSFTIALGGVYLAFPVIAVFLASVVPGIELILYGFSSIFIGLMIMETGFKEGIILYAAAAGLCFILIPNKLAVFPFIFFFGVYGIIKALAEKPQVKWLQITLKILFFTAAFMTVFFFFKELFFTEINLPDLPFPLLLAAGIAVFIAYDIIFTMLINIYVKKIRKSTKFKHGVKSSKLDSMKLYNRQAEAAEDSTERKTDPYTNH